MDAALGQFFAQSVKAIYVKRIGNLDLIASHGHTIFHDPNIGNSLQIGKPNAMASAAQCPASTIFDLLTSYGGQGSPILPFSEEALFPAMMATLILEASPISICQSWD